MSTLLYTPQLTAIGGRTLLLCSTNVAPLLASSAPRSAVADTPEEAAEGPGSAAAPMLVAVVANVCAQLMSSASMTGMTYFWV